MRRSSLLRFAPLVVFAATVWIQSVSAAGPIITSIHPSTVSAGGPAFTLTVSGDRFKKKSRIYWNGSPLDTTRVSSNELTALISADRIATSGAVEITVVRKDATSNVATLTIRDAPTSGYDWTALRAKLQSLVPGTVAGLSLMIARNDETLFAESSGNQTNDTVLPIASSTKMPSGLVILSLVEEGLIGLDEPVATYFEGRIDWPADKAAVTMRMLFNHTSGLSLDAPCLNDRSTTLRDCAQHIAGVPLEFAPGSKFAYGGSSMQVAGYVAEVVTGKKWNDLFAQKIAEPLGLARFTYTSTNNPRIAGGAYSDTNDYTRIMQMFLAGGVAQGKRILSPASIAMMKTDQIAGIPKLRSPGGATLTGYSFGWWHSDSAYLAAQPLPQTIGPELSDQGAFGCTPWIDLEMGYSAILLILDRTSTGTEIWNQIRPLIVEQMMRNR